MFILRTVFWLSLIVAILPTDARQQQQMTSKVVSAVQHASTFCDRNEKVCESGARYWKIFRQKADYGFELVVALISRQLSGNTENPGARVQRSLSNTLRPSDLRSPWRGQPSQNKI